MFWSNMFLYFLTPGLGVLFVLFMAVKLRYFESTKYLFFFTVCLYWLIWNSNLSIIKVLSITFFELEGTSYFIAFLGIFLMFYVQKMIYPVKSFRVKSLKHFIFPIAIMILGILSKSFFIDKKILNVLQTLNIAIDTQKTIPFIIFIIGFSYSIRCFILILQFCKKQPLIFIKTNRKVLIWLKIAIFITIIFITLQLLQFLNRNNTYTLIIVFSQHVLVIALILYILFSPTTVRKMRGCVYVFPEANDEGSSCPLPLAIRGTIYDYWYSTIEDYISIKMPYLNIDFNVFQMASDVGISKRKVILILKYVYKMDFNEFINRHRVCYFLELSNDKAFSSLLIEEKVLRVGFYNKSDFNSHFRKYMNFLPHHLG